MDQVFRLSSELNMAIKNSLEYKDYVRAKEKLHQREDLLRSLVEFRQKNDEIQNDESLDNPFDQINSLAREYDDLIHDTIVNDFIRAERRICYMLKTVYEQMVDGLEFEVTED